MGNCDVIERIRLKYLKKIFKLKKINSFTYHLGEFGILPITTEIQARVISFWCKLTENHDNSKLSSLVYAVVGLHAMHENNDLKSNWIENIKHLLCSLGFSDINGMRKVIQLKQPNKNQRCIFTKLVFYVKYFL